ncbi:MAG: TolC family protein [Ignavibacteria bacterium]|nr:TolC family protein [Ignavibacteria bacterium]
MTKLSSKLFFLLIGLIFIVNKNSVIAQEKLSITVEQAVEIGLKNSKTLHSSLMKVKSAEARVKEVSASKLPSLRLSAAYRRLSEVDPFIVETPFGKFNISPAIFDNYSVQLSLLQPLFTGFRLSSGIEIAELSAESSSEEFNKDKNELVFNVKNSYWGLYKAIEFKKVMDETVEQIKAHVEDAKNLYKVGMLTQNDILKFEVQLSNAQFQQVDTENSVKLAMVALNNVLGIPLSTQIEINSKPNLVRAEYAALHNLVSEAVQKRSEVRAADSRVKMGEANITMVKSSWYPQISVYGNYYYSKPNQRILPSRNQFDGTWDAGISLNLNVWDWLTTSHQTEQAEAQLYQAEDALKIIKDGITMEVTQNYFSFQQSSRKIEIAELAVKQANENMRVTNEKFKSGLVQSSDLIDAETVLISARTNFNNSIIDYELAKAKLDKSIGK